MAKRVRKDPKGRILHRGETYIKKKGLYCYTYTDPLGKRHSVYAPDLLRLRDKEKGITQDKIDGIDLYARATADINFVFDRYISTKSELRSSTKTNYVYTYDRYVRKGFGKKKIADIRFSDVLIYYNALLERGLSVNTVDSVHSVLHPTFQLAVRDRVLRTNPADDVMAELKKKMKGRTEPRHALTLEEQREFLSWIEKPEYDRWRPLFVVMFGTGCRIGEIIGLRWVDVNFNENYIVIDHDVTYYPRSDKNFKCEFEVGRPKTEAGIRDIPISKQVEPVLNDALANYIENPQGLLFYDHDHDKVITTCQVNSFFTRICQKCDINVGGQHALRHTFATRCIEADIQAVVLKNWLGHTDIHITLDTYADVFSSMHHDSISKLDEYISSINKAS